MNPLSLIFNRFRPFRDGVGAMFPFRLGAAAGLGWALAGCQVSLLQDEAENSTRNVCETNAECGDGICKDDVCQVEPSDLLSNPRPFLLEITPPAGTPHIAGVTFTSVLDTIRANGTELKLGHVSRIKGSVRAGALAEENCLLDDSVDAETLYPAGDDDSIPARVTFTPRERLLGLTNQPITAVIESPQVLDPETGEEGFQLELSVPPGRYDVYTEPLPTSDGCVRPPFLVVDRVAEAGDQPLRLELPPPELMSVTVRYPHSTDDLSAWTLDLVDRDSGRVLSNRAKLGEPTSVEEGLEYSVDLAFSQVDSESSSPASELVRLSPPKDAVAPIIYVERSIVDLFQDGAGLIDQLTELPDPVAFEGPIVVAGEVTKVPGKVTFVATSLRSTEPGTLAAFSRTVDTDETGVYQVDLLPGDYKVLVEPFNSKYSRALSSLSVNAASDSQVGRSLSVTTRNTLTGQVLSFTGAPISGAPVVATAAPEAQGVLKTALGEIAISPTAYGMATDFDGRFELFADTGTFYVSARPESSTGFPWRVLLDVDVGVGQTSVGRVGLTLPLVVRGTLTSQDTGFVPDALIRIYAFISDGVPVDSADEADSVVAVGESRVDSDGRFRLLLPSAL